MVVQRNNLMLLLKLVIKGLFRHRSKLVMTAECRTYFEHLFVLLEKCLQHGLKRKCPCENVQVPPFSKLTPLLLLLHSRT